MKIRPIKRYAEPSYPNVENYRKDPQQGFPQISPKAILVVIMALIANNTYNIKSTAQGKPKVEQLQKSIDDSLVQMDTTRSAIAVAPVFEHGEGRGAVGCVVISPPVFISEEDARNVIVEMLAKHGIEFDVRDKEISDLQFPILDGRPIISYTISDTTYTTPGILEKNILNLDLFSSEHNLGIEFISTKDYFSMGGVSSWSTVQDYDMKKIAYAATEKFSNYGKFNAAVFYDPLKKFDNDGYNSTLYKLSGKISKLMAKKNNTGLTEDEQSKFDSLIKQYKAQWLKRPDYKKALEELRAQVTDFITWLQSKGIIKE